MKKKVALSAIVVAWCATARADSRCALPQSLNIGIPRVATIDTDDVADKLADHLRDVFTAVYRDARTPGSASCGKEQAIQINIALGNDYQMLDWLGQGLIDAAVVPGLTVELLRHDNAPPETPDADTLPMYELNVRQLPGGRELLPERPITIDARVFDASSHTWTRSHDGGSEYEQFLNAIWRTTTGKSGALPKTTIVLGSHVSDSGFVEPIQLAASYFYRHGNPAGLRKTFWANYFDRVRFAVDCKDADSCFASLVHYEAHPPAGDPDQIAPNADAILFPVEEAIPPSSPGNSEHLLITRAAAERIFGVKSASTDPDAIFKPAKSEVPASIAELVKDPPEPLVAAFRPQPLFGTRTYAFKVDESMRLLAQQQRASGEQNLALVLPGGGVKAVYQTHIAQQLYSHDVLRNDVTSSPLTNTLKVKTVIGTSGGALLGYFVSQLDEPIKNLDLYGILWNRNGKVLQTSDVFGMADFLRYVGVVFALAVLCLGLMLRSMRGGEPQPLGTPGFRWRLTFCVMPLFIAAPLYVRLVGDPQTEEVDPLLGILYMIIATFVIVADQALVYEKPVAGTEHAPSRKYDKHILGLLAFAVPLLLITAFGTSGNQARRLPFGIAFFFAVTLIMTATIVLAYAHGKFSNRPVRALEIGGAIAAVLLLGASGRVPHHVPPIYAALALMILAAAELWYLKAGAGGAQWLITLLSVYAIAVLCWPADYSQKQFGLDFLFANATDSLAGLSLIVGILLLIGAGILWTAQQPAYAVCSEAKQFLGATMGILLGYVAVALLGVLAVSWIAPTLVTPLELTWQYWVVLLVTAAGAAAALIFAPSRYKSVRGAVAFLGSPHPNGTVFHRRYGRILAVAAGALFWWNAVEAPGVYGNTSATRYQADAVADFDEWRFRTRNPMLPPDQPVPPIARIFDPAARFVTPANLLRQDGTRYFMFLPANDSEDCPSVQNPRASGAEWTIYRSAAHDSGPCHSRLDEEHVRNIALASGSPFPIFPAHTLKFLPRSASVVSDDDKTFVDGGYSNNIPVDAARAVSARQVLIIDSTNPVPRPEPESMLSMAARVVFGRLVINSTRLLPYLFARSQQVDRLSRHDMFVLALGPSGAHDAEWPPLFDFRRQKVLQLRAWAREDLAKRIGIVESWGRPSFALNATVDPDPAAQ